MFLAKEARAVQSSVVRATVGPVSGVGYDLEKAYVDDLRLSYSTIVEDPSIPLSEKARAFWEEIIKDPDHPDDTPARVATSLGMLIQNQHEKGRPNRQVLSMLINSIVPGYIHSLPPNDGFRVAQETYAVLAWSRTKKNVDVPADAERFEEELLAPWNDDRQLIMLLEAEKASGNQMISRDSRNEFIFRTEIPEGIPERHTRLRKEKLIILLTKLERGNSMISEDMLRLAVAALRDDIPTPLSNAQGMTRHAASFGETYLTSFVSRFQGKGEFLPALRLIAKACENGPPSTKASLLRFMVDKTWTMRGLGGAEFEKQISFSGFLHDMVAAIRNDSSQYHEASHEVGKQLFAATMKVRELEGVGRKASNDFFVVIINYPGLSSEEKVALTRVYIGYLSEYGWHIDVNKLSDETLDNVVRGRNNFHVPAYVDGAPVSIYETGEVVGVYKAPEETPAAVETSGNDSTASSEIPEIEEPAPDTQEEPIFEPVQLPYSTMSPEVEEELLPEAIAENDPLMHESGMIYASGETASSGEESFFVKDTERANDESQENRIEAILTQLFGQAWFSDEKMMALEENRERLWRELEGPGSLRGASFTPGRSRMKLSGEGMAQDTTFPRVEFYHQDQERDGTMRLSDIAGRIVLGGNLSIDFLFDVEGNLQGEVAKLFDADIIPLGTYVALNERVVELAHKALVFDQEKVSERVYKAAVRHLGGSVRTGAEISNGRVEQELVESRRFLKAERAVETRFPNGTIVYIVPIDKEKMYEELQRDPQRKSVHATVPLQKAADESKTDEEVERMWKARGGSRVLLPHGHHPTPQGVAKAEVLKQALVVHFVVERDENGLPHELEFYTTIRLKKEPKPQGQVATQEQTVQDLKMAA